MRKDLLFAIMLLLFSAYMIVVDEPFFIDSPFLKHRVTDAIYGFVGPIGLALISFLLGCLFLYFFIDHRRAAKRDADRP